MATLIIITSILAGYHYLIESIVLDTFRFKIKCKLLKQRDILFSLKTKNKANLEDKVIDELGMVIVSMLQNLNNLSLFELYRYRNKIHAHSEKEEKLISFDRINNHANKQIKTIFDKTMKYSFLGFLINSGGWILYAIPFILIYLIFTFCINGYKKLKALFFGSVETKKAILVIAKKKPVNKDKGEYYGYVNNHKNHNKFELV
jgi:hypothetical protein